MSNDRIQESEPSKAESDTQTPVTTQRAPAAPADSEGHPEPGRQLIEIMGRKLVVALAVGSVLGATLLCLVGIFRATLITSQVSWFFLCLLTAFLFSVFVFTLFPTDYKLDIKVIGIPIVLIGPAALWISLFFIFWHYLPPEDTIGAVFMPAPGSNQLAYSTSWVLGWDPNIPVYYKLKLSPDQDSKNPNLPAGFYVLFDKAHTKYTATIGVGPSSGEIKTRYELVFVRGASTYEAKPVAEKGGGNK